MQTAGVVVLASLALCFQRGSEPPDSAEERQVEFTRDIRPILSDKCFQCHGPDAQHREADLRFDTRAGALADLGGYRAVEPGHPERSELIARITSSDSSLRMPPEESGKQLTVREKELLESWIRQGARWSEHWAYEAPKRFEIPVDSSDTWSINSIDRLILPKLRSRGLQPAAEADRVTLIRRLSFDLTGLPPTPAAVQQFVQDPSPRAYEDLVDRLFASPHYGERMAMYWLDLVRYADTVGYHGDQDHNISPYRDWVVDALNDNMPLDQFTRYQLAGDLIPDATIDHKIASGYNRLLQTSHEGGVQPKEYLTIYAADRVRNVSAVWLGGTLGCAQCHDHKYDPYTQRDFYQMAAFFADIDEAQHFKKGTNALPTARPPEIRVLTRSQRRHVAQLEQRIQALVKQSSQRPNSEPSDTIDQQLAELRQQLKAIRDSARLTMITKTVSPRTVRFLPRGNWLDDSGPIVQPAVPQFFQRNLAVDGRRANRLDLANWLMHQQEGIGGLTARVFANRFWYLMMGTGISANLEDFGGQGEAPVYPELLDHLALQLLDHSWDVKRLLKLIVMSRTYRQSSDLSPQLLEQDPANRWFARQSRYRLPAEMIRDNALMISGLLVTDVGGASIKPYQPSGYYRHLNFPTRKYQHHADPRQWRRGLYVHWQRQFLHPMLRALDAPGREECTAQRPRSNTPLAALVLLNDPTFIEAARVFAERILQHERDSFDARLDFAMTHAISRKPDKTQRRLLRQLYEASLSQYRQQPDLARALIQIGDRPADDRLDVVQLAAWTSVARAILNQAETVTRN